LIAVDCFIKWPEAYAIPNQEALTVADGQITNFFCCFRVPQELHSEHSEVRVLNSGDPSAHAYIVAGLLSSHSFSWPQLTLDSISVCFTTQGNWKSWLTCSCSTSLAQSA
jgi:hypothetical protein